MSLQLFCHPPVCRGSTNIISAGQRSENDINCAPQLLSDDERRRRAHTDTKTLGTSAQRAHRRAVCGAAEHKPQQCIRAVAARAGMLEDLTKPRRTRTAGWQLQECSLGEGDGTRSVVLNRCVWWEHGGTVIVVSVRRAQCGAQYLEETARSGGATRATRDFTPSCFGGVALCGSVSHWCTVGTLTLSIGRI